MRLGLWNNDRSPDFATPTTNGMGDGNDLSYGLGGLLSVGPVDVRLQWRSAELDDVDLSLIDLSAIWRF
jgi:hypothetical protein